MSLTVGFPRKLEKVWPFALVWLLVGANLAIAQNGENSPPSAEIPPGQELVNLDFPEPTDIKDIVKAVSMWTGKNVILDRNVNGKVQIISPNRVTKEEAYQAFLSALNILGLTTVETGKVIKILPVRKAVKGNLKTFLGTQWTPLTDEVITQIVPLRYIDAKQIQQTLRRIVNSRSMLAYQPTNTLIISDSGYKIRRLLDIIALLDVKGQQPKLEIIPIRFSDAKNVATKVTTILKTTGRRRGKKSRRASYHTYKLMPDERTNSVVVFGPPRTIRDIKDLVKKFDVSITSQSSQRGIRVRPIDFSDAKKMAATLSSLVQASSKKSKRRRVTRSRSKRRSRRKTNTTNTSQISSSLLASDIKITADESTNALLIQSSRAAYDALNTLIRKLDRRKAQVFMEADILDISLDNRFTFGSSFLLGRPGPKGSSAVSTFEAGGIAPLIVNQTQTGNGSTVNQAQAQAVANSFAQDLTIGVIAGAGIDVPGLGTINPGLFMRLLKADGATQTLATPRILTVENEEATITVGQKIFFNAGTQVSNSGVATSQVKDEKVDLTMKVTPSVSQSNYITLDLEIEASSADTDPTSNLPKLATRKTQQNVTVKNGQTVVVSGLQQKSKLETYRKIPLLGDIPLLGWLFRNSNLTDTSKQLMIFIKTHAIYGQQDFEKIMVDREKERQALLRGEFPTILR